jgi:hypothetical protein
MEELSIDRWAGGNDSRNFERREGLSEAGVSVVVEVGHDPDLHLAVRQIIVGIQTCPARPFETRATIPGIFLATTRGATRSFEHQTAERSSPDGTASLYMPA